MYSKEQAAEIKKAFWTTYGRYMSPIPSSEGMQQNWINYHTGIKHLFFKTQAENKKAYTGIRLTHPDAGMRSLLYEQFMQLIPLLHHALQEDWIWEEQAAEIFGKAYTHIYIERENLSIFKKEDWPELISFFKPRIIALDTFWNEVKDSFEIFK